MCVTGWMTKETYLWSWMMCFVKKFQVIRKHTVFLISCNILWYFYRTILASEKSRSIISWNKKVFKLYLFQKNELNQVFVLHPFPASTIKSYSQFAWLTISHISKISPKSVCSRTFSDYRAQPSICLATGAEAAPGRAPEGCYQGTCSGLVPDSILYCCHLEILNNFLTRAPTFPLFTGPTHYASGPEQHKQSFSKTGGQVRQRQFGFRGNHELWWRRADHLQDFKFSDWQITSSSLCSREALSPQVEGLTIYEMPRNQKFPVMIKGEKSKGLWDLY